MSSQLMFAVFGLSGVAAGFFAGLFGIGGGLIMVPVLVYAFKATGMVGRRDTEIMRYPIPDQA